MEHIRNTAAHIDPTMNEYSALDNPHDEQYSSVRDGLFVGAVLTLLLIGAGLIISTVEQLHERRRLLSALDAFGTRRATLAWSVLWQTALPVTLGLGLALGCGLTLGTLLLTMIDSGGDGRLAGGGGDDRHRRGVILFVTRAEPAAAVAHDAARRPAHGVTAPGRERFGPRAACGSGRRSGHARPARTGGKTWGCPQSPVVRP